MTDRGQRAAIAYDARGNVTWTARQMAVISSALGDFSGTPTLDATGRPSVAAEEVAPAAGTVEYDETHPYIRTASFDHANRPIKMGLPSDPDYVGTAPLVAGSLSYNRRGLPAGAIASIGGTVHTIVGSIQYERDGLVSSMTYGDNVATSSTVYDIRRRPTLFTTTRTPDSGAAAPALAAVSTVVAQQLVWDAANNLTAQIDHRDPAEWPAGHRPQTVAALAVVQLDPAASAMERPAVEVAREVERARTKRAVAVRVAVPVRDAAD